MNDTLKDFLRLSDGLQLQESRMIRQLTDASSAIEWKESQLIRQLADASRAFQFGESLMVRQFTDIANSFELQQSQMIRQLADTSSAFQLRESLISQQLAEIAIKADETFLATEVAMRQMIASETALFSKHRLKLDELFQGSVASLESLGTSLRLPVFGFEESELLRSALGDWRGISVPEVFFSDCQARGDFYRSLGFDSSLTELPEPIFTESLHLTTVWQPTIFSPSLVRAEERQPAVSETSDPAQAIKQRMVESYDALVNFELQVRAFLVNTMSKRYGREWSKQRVPSNTLADWRRKRDEEVSKGLTARPLIDYADFSDYSNILMRTDNWDEVFAEIFANKDDVKVSFQRLSALRICTMHARGLSKDDFLIIIVETGRLLRAIGSGASKPTIADEDN